MQQTADSNAPSTSQEGGGCTLQLLYSGRLGIVIEAPRRLENQAAIGRDPAAAAICLLDDDRVSRLHATLQPSSPPSEWRIVDSGSRHGVFINGARSETHLLRDGDIVRIGNSFLCFRAALPTVDDEQVATRRHPATSTMLGTSLAMQTLRRTIERTGPSDSSVMLLGESGTGKELTARALHQLSGRARGPFIAVNCSAIPESLAESLLFGHDKGAFTGADRAKEGYFRAAHGGTLFLDEIAELPRTIQPKLLRAIEDRAVFPVGTTRPVEADVRILCATHRNIVRDIGQGEFRGDLFFRLADLTIDLPPLRARREDILPILLSQWKSGSPRIAPQLAEALLLHPWPYNVRELLTIARELQTKGLDGAEHTLALVAERLAIGEQLHLQAQPPPARSTPATHATEESALPSRDELVELLRRHKGNISAISREKQRSRTQIERWLEARGIDKERL